jgi:N-acetyl-anhydromuramyl-L-alanine amidase AmpD
MPSEWSTPVIPAPRVGDEIVVCGEFLHTDAPNLVVCWFDPNGFDAYSTKPALRMDTAPGATPKQVSELGGESGEVLRYGSRRLAVKSMRIVGTPEVGISSPTRGGAGFLVTDKDDLTEVITQFVIHHNELGSSERSFQKLHGERGLSCHFLIDVDGRIFQTLDVMQRAWHATDANDVSIGVELASLGAFREPNEDAARPTPFDVTDAENVMENRDFVRGVVNGTSYVQKPYTEKQYDAVSALYCALLKRFRNLKLAYPVDGDENAFDFASVEAPRDGTDAFKESYPACANEKLTDERRRAYAGALGHFHVENKQCDPGPAFDWKRLIRDTNALVRVAEER